MLMTPGTRLGCYEILGPLGAGGMGEVYLARDTRLDREVALKLLPRRLATEPEAIARFRREALTLASLTHPNIATVHGFEETEGGPMVLVLERVEGESLAERLSRGALRPEEALQVCAQIAQALEAAHERGVIHRDVKPANVMIGPRGIVKVLDFGLARRTPGIGRPTASEPDWPPDPGSAPGGSDLPAAGALPGGPTPAELPILDDAETIKMSGPGRAHEEAKTARAMPRTAPSDEAETIAVFRRAGVADEGGVTGSGTILGTPGYLSPEQVLASEVDARTDVFAFGCVLYECLAWRRAFSGRDVRETVAAVLDQIPDLSALPAGTPARVRTLIQQCLEKKPSQRLATMRSARVELEEVLGIRRASALREGESYSTPHNLPGQTTSFVGRTAVLGECRRLLGASRLLTLAGMGGTGKTRVALHLAQSLLGAYPDGVWFVNLAPLADSGRVADVAAETLSVADEPGRTPLESLTRHVRDRQMLFVLDNCEEVLEGAAALASSLLRTCPAVRVLVTSRQALGLDGESVLAVPPLAIPGAEDSPGAEALRDCEAVQLFVDRAVAAHPDFALTTANAPAVAEICRRLDGIPLALELAASRIRMLGVEQIRARLDDRFKLLTRPGSDAPSRRQTVKAVIQWSWDHLLPPEQDLMRRLAVFTGGWTLERATAVCSDSGDEFEVLDLLTRLVERSLVVLQRAADGSVRYRFLESVWRFALETLATHREHPALRERHLATYLALAEGAEETMTGAGLQQGIQDLIPEEENVLAAFAWCAQADDGVQRGLRLAAAVQRFWSLLGRYALGRRVLEDALARDAARTPTPARAMALVRAGGFALVMGDYAAARPHLEESLAISRVAGDTKGVARALAGLCVTAMWQSRLEEALQIGEESLALYRELDEQRGVAMALHNLGIIESALKRPGYGRTRVEAALALLRAREDKATETLCLASLASSLLRGGDTAGTCLRLRECLALLEELDLARESFTLLDVLAEWLLATGRPVESARMMGAAASIRTALGAPLMPVEREGSEDLRLRIAVAIGEDAARRSLAEGAALSREQALTEATVLLDSDQSG